MAVAGLVLVVEVLVVIIIVVKFHLLFLAKLIDKFSSKSGGRMLRYLFPYLSIYRIL